MAFNKKNHITPITIKKPIEEQQLILRDTKHIPDREKERLITQMEIEMRAAAGKLDFELAIALRDQISGMQKELDSKKFGPANEKVS